LLVELYHQGLRLMQHLLRLCRRRLNSVNNANIYMQKGLPMQASPQTAEHKTPLQIVSVVQYGSGLVKLFANQPC
jgi:hypothetical protein